MDRLRTRNKNLPRSRIAHAAIRDGNSHSAKEFALLPTSKCGSASLKYRSFKVAGKKLIQQPDAQFLSDLRLLPSLIIEVTWTQTTKNLQELVCDYILGSNARIRTVIGFDVGPAPRKRATVCDWRTVHNEDNIAVTCDSTVGVLPSSPSTSLI